MSETSTEDLRGREDYGTGEYGRDEYGRATYGAGGRPPAPTGPVVGTIVWGGVLVVLGVLAVLTALLGWHLDPVIVLIGILALAGVALVAAAVVTLLRR